MTRQCLHQYQFARLEAQHTLVERADAAHGVVRSPVELGGLKLRHFRDQHRHNVVDSLNAGDLGAVHGLKALTGLVEIALCSRDGVEGTAVVGIHRANDSVCGEEHAAQRGLLQDYATVVLHQRRSGDVFDQFGQISIATDLLKAILLSQFGDEQNQVQCVMLLQRGEHGRENQTMLVAEEVSPIDTTQHVGHRFIVDQHGAKHRPLSLQRLGN